MIDLKKEAELKDNKITRVFFNGKNIFIAYRN